MLVSTFNVGGLNNGKNNRFIYVTIVAFYLLWLCHKSSYSINMQQDVNLIRLDSSFYTPLNILHKAAKMATKCTKYLVMGM